MGLDVAAVQMLCCAKSLAVDFSDVLTIGRQEVHWTSSFTRSLLSLGLSRQAISLVRGERYCEPLFKLLGAERVSSLDASDYEQATYICDLNRPCSLDMGQFSVVFDGGSLEHVFNLPQALKTVLSLVRLGGHFIQVIPANNYMGHGFWQLSPEVIYRMFSPESGFVVRVVLLHEAVSSSLPHVEGVWYLVSDPAVSGDRVELINRRPTYICTIAERVKEVEVFGEWPQQADYSRAWDVGEWDKSGWRKLIPVPIKRGLLSGVRMARVLLVSGRKGPSFYREYFRHISARNVVRGRV